jgi:hypothetical protein
METSLYTASQAGLVLLTLVYVSLFLNEVRKGLASSGLPRESQRRFFSRLVAVVVIWAILVSAWSASGKMGDFSTFPLNLMPVLLVPLILLCILVYSKTFSNALHLIPPERIVRLQSFRFFVEISLWAMFTADLLPVQMTFEGRNFDILAGLSAIPVSILISRGKLGRTGLIVWNVICLGLLLNIVIVAILSTPSPWRIFINEPANNIVTRFPVSWLPGMLVPLAYYLHVLSIKQLIAPSKSARAAAREQQAVGQR